MLKKMLCIILVFTVWFSYSQPSLAVDEETLRDQIANLHDSLYTGLGVVGYKPYKSFGKNETVNLQNGNLVYNYSDIIVPGRGIPLRLSRVYNSQWSKPIFNGFINLKKDAINPYWQGDDYFNGDPEQDHIAGMKLTITRSLIEKQNFWEFLNFDRGSAPSSVTEPGLTFVGTGILIVGLVVGFFAFMYWAGSGLYSTNLFLSHPKDQLTVNEIYGIIPKYPNEGQVVGMVYEDFDMLEEITLIRSNGGTLTFERDETGQYVNKLGVNDYKVELLNGGYEGIMVYTPSGLKYRLKRYAPKIYSTQSYEHLTFPYFLPAEISDYHGNMITIEREIEPPYRITKIIDTLDQETTITREGLKEMIKLPDQREYTYFFNENGYIKEIEDPLGNKTKFGYMPFTYDIDLLNFSFDSYLLESVEYHTGAKVEYESPFAVTARHETAGVGDDENVTLFKYSLNIEDENPTMLYQTTTVIDAEGHKTKYVFQNPYEGEERLAKFPWTLVKTIEGIGENELITYYTWTEARKIHEVSVQKGQVGSKTRFEYDQYGNPTKIEKNIPLEFDLVNVDDANNITATELAGPNSVVEYGYEYINQEEIYLVNQPNYTFVDLEGENDVKIWLDYDKYTNVTTGEVESDEVTSLSPKGLVTQVRAMVTTELEGTPQEIMSQKVFYDEYGNQRVMIDAKGNVFEIKYDSSYHLPIENIQYKNVNGANYTFKEIEEKIDAGGYFEDDYLSIKKGYNPLTKRLDWSEDFNGNRTNYKFDLMGRLLSKILPNGTTESYQYLNYTKDGLNQTIKTIGDEKQSIITKATMNGIGWVLKEETVVDDKDNSVSKSYTYDHLGRVLTETDLLQNSTGYEYDSYGRVTKVIHPDKSIVQSNYTYTTLDVNGQRKFGLLTTVYNEKGAKLERFNDVDGHLLQQIRFKRNLDGQFEVGEFIKYDYDQLGNLVKVQVQYEENKVDKFQTINYQVNEIGSVLSTEYADGTTERYKYDLLGNVKEKTTKGGELVTYEYDRLNRVTEVEYSIDQAKDYHLTSENELIVFEYDEDVPNGKGNQTSVTDSTGTISYTYDALNRIDQMSQKLDQLTATWTTDYNYNGLGLVDSIIYPSGVSVEYTYNSLGLTDKVFLNNHGEKQELVHYEKYNDNGAMSEVSYGQGLIDLDYTYHPRQWVKSISAQNFSGKELFSEVNEYDLAGNRVKITGTYGVETGYQYDDLNQLILVDFPGDEAQGYSYDQLGNRTHVSYKYGYGSGHIQQHTYNYDRLNNQLDQVYLSDHSYYDYKYNDNGSLIDKSLIRGEDAVHQTAIKYDLQNRVREIRIKNMLAGTENQVAFSYNHNGWRVKKDTGLATTYYVYGSGINVLEERDADNKLQRLFVYANGRRIASQNAAGELKYSISDLLGSNSVVIDKQGKDVARFSYTPFGSLRTSEMAIDEAYRFTGKEFDGATGLYYYGARYYDPTIGRFISEDPAQDGLNWYQYCRNNPLILTDPNGQVVTLASVAIVAGTGAVWGGGGYMLSQVQIQIGDPWYTMPSVSLKDTFSWRDLAINASSGAVTTLTATYAPAVAMVTSVGVNMGQVVLINTLDGKETTKNELLIAGLVGGISGQVGGNINTKYLNKPYPYYGIFTRMSDDILDLNTAAYYSNLGKHWLVQTSRTTFTNLGINYGQNVFNNYFPEKDHNVYTRSGGGGSIGTLLEMQ